MTRNYLVCVQTVLLFLLVIIENVELFISVRNGCSTPDGRSGSCVPLTKCQPVRRFVEDSKRTTPYVTRRLEDYACGRQGESSKICCPPDSVIPTEEIPDPPDLTSHRNVHLLPEECGLIGIGDKIRNGEDAEFNEFPWMALLSYETPNGPSFQCGGTIISERYILTAAHCVANLTFALKGVRVGEYNLNTKLDCHNENCNPPVQDLAVEKVIYPEDYNVTLFANDVALVRVSKINLNGDNVAPVCLPILKELREMALKKGIVTGWGFTDPHGSVATILQKVTLERRDLSVCTNAYSVQPAIKLNYRQMCIGGIARKDSCRGDSGGPFHIATHFNEEDRYVQFGIVSIGPLYCGYDGVPGIYASVTYYLDWILDHMES